MTINTSPISLIFWSRNTQHWLGDNFRIILFIFCYKINIMEHLRGWWSQSVDNYCVKRTFPVVWCSSASFIRKIPQIIFFPGNLIQLKMNCILTLNLFHPFLLPNIHKYLFKILFYPPEPTLPPSVLQIMRLQSRVSRRRSDECYCLERNVSLVS